jgi:hypothetical protein
MISGVPKPVADAGRLGLVEVPVANGAEFRATMHGPAVISSTSTANPRIGARNGAAAPVLHVLRVLQGPLEAVLLHVDLIGANVTTVTPMADPDR